MSLLSFEECRTKIFQGILESNSFEETSKFTKKWVIWILPHRKLSQRRNSNIQIQLSPIPFQIYVPVLTQVMFVIMRSRLIFVTVNEVISKPFPWSTSRHHSFLVIVKCFIALFVFLQMLSVVPKYAIEELSMNVLAMPSLAYRMAVRTMAID